MEGIDLSRAVINFNTLGDHAVIPSVPGKRIEVWQVFLYNVVAQNLEFRDNSDTLTGPLTNFPATSGFSLPYTGAPHFLLQSGQALILRMSANSQVSGFVNYLLKD